MIELRGPCCALAIAILKSGVRECDVRFLISSWAEDLAKMLGFRFDVWEAAVDRSLKTKFENGTRVKNVPDWRNNLTYQERQRRGWK